MSDLQRCARCPHPEIAARGDDACEAECSWDGSANTEIKRLGHTLVNMRKAARAFLAQEHIGTNPGSTDAEVIAGLMALKGTYVPQRNAIAMMERLEAVGFGQPGSANTLYFMVFAICDEIERLKAGNQTEIIARTQLLEQRSEKAESALAESQAGSSNGYESAARFRDKLEESKAREAAVVDALEKIKSETCTMGSEWGNSAVHALAESALEAVKARRP